MRYPAHVRSALCSVLLALVTALTGSAPAVAQTVDYSRAERFLTWNTERVIAGAEVNPNWMETGDTDRFWYRNNTGSGYEFVLVNPAVGSRDLLFDHYRMAAAMSLAGDTSYVGDNLPFTTFSRAEGESSIQFVANNRRFSCDLAGYECTVADTLPSQLPYVKSPDGRWEAFSHEYNLYVRTAGGGDSIQLTTDGEKYYAYGYNEPSPNRQRQGPAPRTPTLSWSPDSRHVAVARRDERSVEHMHYISYTSQRPRHFSQPYALPGDSVIPLPSVHIVTLEEGDVAANHRVEVAPVPHHSPSRARLPTLPGAPTAPGCTSTTSRAAPSGCSWPKSTPRPARHGSFWATPPAPSCRWGTGAADRAGVPRRGTSPTAATT